jgi:hypothetical protein
VWVFAGLGVGIPQFFNKSRRPRPPSWVLKLNFENGRGRGQDQGAAADKQRAQEVSIENDGIAPAGAGLGRPATRRLHIAVK